jgi:hypothetical protein
MAAVRAISERREGFRASALALPAATRAGFFLLATSSPMLDIFLIYMLEIIFASM